jgi:hypothetical protein
MKLVRKPSASDGWYKITPEDAVALLNTMSGNRPLKQGRVSNYVHSITSGDWKENGEPIIINTSGELVDGQHRCEAVVAAAKPIISYVVFQPRSEFASIDTGVSRSPGDIMSLGGYTKAHNTVASICRLLYVYDNLLKGRWPTGGEGVTTNAELLQYALDHESELMAALDLTEKARKSAPRLFQASWTGTLYTLTRRAYGEARTDAMFERLITGESLAPDSALLLFRNRLLGNVAVKAKLSSTYKLALGIKAVRAELSSTPQKQLKYADDEVYPRFDTPANIAASEKKPVRSLNDSFAPVHARA